LILKLKPKQFAKEINNDEANVAYAKAIWDEIVALDSKQSSKVRRTRKTK
jgi:hypothetical protein